jgi:hypothetical protein
LLVLVKATRTQGEKDKATILDTPTFVRGRDLSSVTESWSRTLKTELGVIVCGYMACAGGHVATLSARALETLCVIAPDGRTLELSFPQKQGWALHRAGSVTLSRRDAIVAALRGDSQKPFESVDGPCGVFGAIDWDNETRKRVGDFLARITDHVPVRQESLLVQALRNPGSKADPVKRAAATAMVLATVRWRDQPEAEPPAFILDVELNALERDLSAMTAVEVASLLSANAGGMRAWENLRVERFCAIGSDGTVLWWSDEKRSWRRNPSKPPVRDWVADIVAGISGVGVAQGWAEECAISPTHVSHWNSDQKRDAIEFLQRLPMQERARPNEILARLEQEASTQAPTAVNVMVLPYAFTAGVAHVLAPVFIRTADLSGLSDAIRSLTTEATMALAGHLSLADIARSKELAKRSVCLVTADGNLAVFRSSDQGIWSEKTLSTTNSEWRADALHALDGQQPRNFTALPCFPYKLTHDWSVETRSKVVTFLEGITARTPEQK